MAQRQFYTNSKDSQPDRAPSLHILAGPNGSGKSTFTRDVIEGRRTINYDLPTNIINPDVIAHKLNPNNPDAVMRQAGKAALVERDVALTNREDFGIETTLTGAGIRRLIADAEASGYDVTMTYVCVRDAELAIRRVELRALTEIRTVAPNVVLRRYPMSLVALADVASILKRIHVYDNSGKTLELVAQLNRGRAVFIAPNAPRWAEEALRVPFTVARDRDAISTDAAAVLAVRNPTARIVEDALDVREIKGEVIATSAMHAALATSATSFVIVERSALDAARLRADKMKLRADVGDPLRPPPRRRRLLP